MSVILPKKYKGIREKLTNVSVFHSNGKHSILSARVEEDLYIVTVFRYKTCEILEERVISKLGVNFLTAEYLFS